jgi:Ca-activated chloride channel family protein
MGARKMNRGTSSGRGRGVTQRSRLMLVVLLIALFGSLAVCGACWGVASTLLDRDERTPVADEETGTMLTVAYSPEKAILFQALVERFNAQRLKTDDGEPMRVRAVEMDPEEMLEAIADGTPGFQAMTPDSSVWLGQLESGGNATVVGETVRYAVSPVVIAMWEEVARELGWPDRPVGWADLLSRAQSDSNFRWSHPSTSSASGLLATLAEFYAGAGKTRGLTIEDVQSQPVLDYVAALEKTVRFYGEGDEMALVNRALAEGRSLLDAFVVQEQMVVYFNQQRRGDRLVAIYPVEGALWEDHPLVLLETSDLTATQRAIFARFRDELLSAEAQALILETGYRPADLSLPLDGSDSPLTAENGVNPAEPRTALQIPSPSVVEVVRQVWWYTKRHTSVYLVVDTSGSMRGQKLSQAQEALRVFLDQIQGDLERVGMIRFASNVQTPVYLADLGANRGELEAAIDELEAAGDTALLDAVWEAYQRLQAEGDPERINAIVAMTDGKENNSRMSLNALVSRMQEGNQQGVPVVVFCIAYGSDADMWTLETLAGATGGQVRQGDLETIRELYKILSTYF